MAKRRTIPAALEIALIGAAVIGAGWGVFRATLYRPPPAPKATAAARPADEAVVVSVTGEVQRSGPDGSWLGIHVGQRLRADDSVRTGRGGRTDLQVGDKSRLTIVEASQLTIRELTEKVHRFKLTRGRVNVDYRPDGARVLRVEDAAGEAVAETSGARFSMLSTGTAVAIAADAGDVALTARQQTVRVAQGQQAVAQAGQPPSPPEPIPVKLLLKVANAAAGQAVREVCAEIEGEAQAGAEVVVDGVPASLGAGNRFRVSVPRAQDKNQVRVAMRDAAGRLRESVVACGQEVPPIRDFAVRWNGATEPEP